MRNFKAALAATIALVPAVAHADEAEGDAIVVTANRQEQDLSEVAQSVTVISNAEIAQRQSIAVTDLLRTVPGVRVSATGGLGTITSVFIRGGNSDHTVALIDGVKINDPSTTAGGYDFGNLVTGNVERIEVVRGSQSVLWGSQAIGGVVNVITRQPTEDLAADASAEYGWRDTARVVGNVSGKFGPVSLRVGGNYARTDGFSSVAAGTERDAYRNYGANAKVNVAFTDAISLDLRGWYWNSRTDIDGASFVFPYDPIDSAEFARMRQVIGYAGLNVALFDGRLRNRFGFAVTDTHRRLFDPARPLQTPSQQVQYFDSKGRIERFEYQGIAQIADWADATFGAETEKSRYSSAYFDLFFPSQTRGSVRQNSFYGQLTVKPLEGLALTGGVRHDDHDDFGGKTTFAANGVFTPNQGATTSRASYSQGFKAPSLYQLHSEYGNAALLTESSSGWEAGVTQKLVDGRMELGATWFQRNTRNLVDFVNCTPPLAGICTNRPLGTYGNVGRARSKGLEATVTLRPTDAFTVQGAYSWVKSTDRATGLDLARRPRHSVSLLADYQWGFGLSTGATVTQVSGSWSSPGEFRRLEGYVLVDLRAALPIGDHVEVFGRVENLFDERYQTVADYGTPGRAAYVGARFKL